MKFVLYKDMFWLEYNPRTPLFKAELTNFYGSKRVENIKNMIMVEAESFYDLNWKGTSVLNNKYKTGWLAPNGEFFGCCYFYHSFQADVIHRKSERELENSGYVKISLDMYKNLYAIISLDKKDCPLITKEQLKFLKSSRIDIFKYMPNKFEENNEQNDNYSF